jgi:hypothetical protein
MPRVKRRCQRQKCRQLAHWVGRAISVASLLLAAYPHCVWAEEASAPYHEAVLAAPITGAVITDAGAQGFGIAVAGLDVVALSADQASTLFRARGKWITLSPGGVYVGWVPIAGMGEAPQLCIRATGGELTHTITAPLGELEKPGRMAQPISRLALTDTGHAIWYCARRNMDEWQQSLLLIDAATGEAKPLPTGATPGSTSVAAADGVFVVAHDVADGESVITAYDVAGASLWSLPCGELQPCTVTASADGKRVACAMVPLGRALTRAQRQLEGRVWVVDARTGDVSTQAALMNPVCFARGGDALFGVTGSGVALADAMTGGRLWEYSVTDEGRANASDIAGGGGTLGCLVHPVASAVGAARPPSRALVFRADGALLWTDTLERDDEGRLSAGLAISPNGSRFGVWQGNRLRIYDVSGLPSATGD